MSNNKIFVLALDGVPYTLLKQLIELNLMPNLNDLAQKGFLVQMDSVQPPVSSTAWASFMTGLKPGDHGIYGFVDRNPKTMEWIIPQSNNLRGKTLWEILSTHQKRVFVMNVPVTYPPRKVNGISICGFLGNDIVSGTYPKEFGYILKSRGYRIDADTELAKSDLFAFYDDLNIVLQSRIDTLWYFWQREPWDFFMVHIMETDRLHHFFWQFYCDKIQPYYDMFLKFYQKIDTIIGQIANTISDDMGLLLLSDHGFTSLKKEVNLNRWLADENYLSFINTSPSSLKEMDTSSIAYSLYPGRIYLNLKGRECYGRIGSGVEYEQTRNELKNKIQNLVDPETGDRVVKDVIYGENVFTNGLTSNLAGRSFAEIQEQSLPDLMVLANEGYELKGILTAEYQFIKQHFTGMHTYDDAFLLGKNLSESDCRLSIDQVQKQILDYLSINY